MFRLPLNAVVYHPGCCVVGDGAYSGWLADP
jgi:hypothetical protein